MARQGNYKQVIRLKDSEGFGGTIVLSADSQNGTSVEAWLKGEVSIDAVALSLLSAAVGLCQQPMLRAKLLTTLQIYTQYVEGSVTGKDTSPPDEPDEDEPF